MDQARKLQVQKFVFAGLLAILGLGLMNTLKFVRPASGARPAQTPAPLSRQLETLSHIEAVAGARHAGPGGEDDRLPIRYTASDYRDPLVSLLPQPEQAQMAELLPKPAPVAPNVTIEGMWWGGQRPQVLIDGKLYEIGDTVQDSEIVEISRDGVTVVNQGTRFVLRPPRTAVSAQGPMMEHGR